MRLSLVLSSFAILILLSACGKGELFGEVKPIPPEGGPSVEDAACICGNRDGTYSALFNSQPSAYGHSSMRVYSYSCQTTIFCEDLGGQTFKVIEGKTITLGNLQGNWSTVTNYRGNVYYQARGTASVSFNFPPMSRPSVLFAGLHLSKVAFTTPNGKTCKETCVSGDPSCFAINLPDTEGAGLRALQDLLRPAPTLVAQSDMIKLFGMSEDKCGRSDTTIADGVVSNTAAGHCNIISDVPNSNVSLVIDVPERVEGSWEQSGNDIAVNLKDDIPKPTLSFVPTDDTQPTDDAKQLQADFGGEISELFAVTGSLGFGVGNGSCIMGTFE